MLVLSWLSRGSSRKLTWSLLGSVCIFRYLQLLNRLALRLRISRCQIILPILQGLLCKVHRIVISSIWCLQIKLSYRHCFCLQRCNAEHSIFELLLLLMKRRHWWFHIIISFRVLSSIIHRHILHRLTSCCRLVCYMLIRTTRFFVAAIRLLR